MNNIGQIDQNLKVEKTLGKEDIVFYNCLEEPFSVHGLLLPQQDGEPFRRIPQEVAEQAGQDDALLLGHPTKGMVPLSLCTAGGRVRFCTDSPYVAVRVELVEVGKFSHMAFTGSVGMDLYERRDGKECFVKTFVPPVDVTDAYESIIEFLDAGEHELTLNLPLYSGVRRLWIGLAEGSGLWKSRDYTHPLPVVYYGSSITQGGCASRPGNSYQSMISQQLDCDYVNLGFSGSATAQQAIQDYISKLPMKVFVYDYDQNAPSPEFLAKTHQPMFETIRKANPDLPIILCSKPSSSNIDQTEKRKAVIRKTYEDAIAKGDRNVYLIYGSDMMAPVAENWSVDGGHPNDLGFWAMAEAIGEVLKTLL